jgi:hypothetical protein
MSYDSFMKTTTLPLKHLMKRTPFRLALLLIPLALACFALAPTTRAVSPPPEGGYPGGNTAEGTRALLSLTTGVGNSALGFQALKFNTTGNQNTATGFQALLRNTTGVNNTATGTDALQSNKTGINNTAIGVLALQSNDASELGIGNFNTAVGVQALFSNVDGNSNNAVGFNALGANVDGLFNQAMGFDALSANGNGSANIAIGDTALLNGTSGSFNTVIGDQAGLDITDGTDNIYIGATPGNGFGNESGHIRIGDPNFVSTCFIAGISGVAVTGDPVVVNANGQLGVAAAGHPLAMKELLKQRQIVQELQGQIQTLTAALKQQAEQIQKVSAQLELSKSAPQTVLSDQ